MKRSRLAEAVPCILIKAPGIPQKTARSHHFGIRLECGDVFSDVSKSVAIALERKDLANFQGRVLYILSGGYKVGCTNPLSLARPSRYTSMCRITLTRFDAGG